MPPAAIRFVQRQTGEGRADFAALLLPPARPLPLPLRERAAAARRAPRLSLFERFLPRFDIDCVQSVRLLPDSPMPERPPCTGEV